MICKRLDVTINSDGRKEINQFKILRTLGKGAQGKVKKARNTLNNEYYAIKILKAKRIGNIEEFKREIAIKKKLYHKNTIYLYEVIEDEARKKFYLVLDYMDVGPFLEAKFWKYE